MIFAMEIKTKAVAKGRPRYSPNGAYTPRKTKEFEELVQLSFMRKANKENIFKQPSERPINVRIEIEFRPPESLSHKKFKALVGAPHIHRPDVDNIAKAILDALNGLAYKDDNQVSDLYIKKRYGVEDRIVVILEEIMG